MLPLLLRYAGFAIDAADFDISPMFDLCRWRRLCR